MRLKKNVWSDCQDESEREREKERGEAHWLIWMHAIATRQICLHFRGWIELNWMRLCFFFRYCDCFWSKTWPLNRLSDGLHLPLFHFIPFLQTNHIFFSSSYDGPYMDGRLIGRILKILNFAWDLKWKEKLTSQSNSFGWFISLGMEWNSGRSCAKQRHAPELIEIYLANLIRALQLSVRVRSWSNYTFKGRVAVLVF